MWRDLLEWLGITMPTNEVQVIGCVTLYADRLGTVDLYADAIGTATAYSQALGTVDVYAGIC